MTILKPRCPALHPGLPYSRCGHEEGHDGHHRTFTDLEWENTMHPDGRLTWPYTQDDISEDGQMPNDAEGGVTAGLIEKEVERLTQQIANQAHNAREDQRVIEEQECQIQELRHAEQAEGREGEAQDELVALRNMVSLAEDRAETAEQERDEVRADRDQLAAVLDATARQRDEADKRAEQPRPLTADDIYDNPEMTDRAIAKGMEWGLFGSRDRDQAEAWNRVEQLLVAALTETTRPDGAAELEAVLSDSPLRHETVRGALADFLASRGVRVTGRE